MLRSDAAAYEPTSNGGGARGEAEGDARGEALGEAPGAALHSLQQQPDARVEVLQGLLDLRCTLCAAGAKCHLRPRCGDILIAFSLRQDQDSFDSVKRH